MRAAAQATPTPSAHRFGRQALWPWITLAVLGHLVLLWQGQRLLSMGSEVSGPLRAIAMPTLQTRSIDTPVREAVAPPSAKSKPKPKARIKQAATSPPQRAAQTTPTDAPVGNEAAGEPTQLTSPAGPPAAAREIGPADAVALTGEGATIGPKDAAPPLPAPATAKAKPAVQVPPPMRLGYQVKAEVKHLPYQANGEMTWTHDGEHYEAQASISAFLIGSRTQTSQGDITPTGLAPRRFGDKAKREFAAHFDAPQGKVTFSANTPDAAWLPGIQDRLSVFMQLAAMVAADPPQFATGVQVTVPTVGPRDAETWVFTVDGSETLRLRVGEWSTLKLTRNPKSDTDTRVELWLAPEIHYLPARIRITQASGDYVEQLLDDAPKP